jgi:guanylate kinase
MTGSIFIVSAPSGAGKTTLVAHLLKRDAAVHLSISYATRTPRSGEKDGVDYHFTDVADFLARRERDEFVESAEVHGNYYGSSRPWLEKQLQAGHDVLLEIDWQGAQQVRERFPEAVAIFIMPPSLAVLEQRLRGRGTDSEEIIARRLAAAINEMRQVDRFDYVIINNELQVAVDELHAVVRAARLRTALVRKRQPASFLPIA